VAHVSAATAPVALGLAAHLGSTLSDALAAYADGFETMAALAEASHPALYDRGWHPTAVCGPAGAAAVASRLLGLSAPQRESAFALAMLRAGGARGAFGTDGKSIQVGLAAAAGLQATLLARAGAEVDRRAVDGPLGAITAAGGTWTTRGDRPAIERNWIKLHPTCLGTHAAIDAAEQARAAGYAPTEGAPGLTVTVDPLSRQAAHLDEVSDGLAAKFSIPYCVAFTLRHGPPGTQDFAALEPQVTRAAQRVQVEISDRAPAFSAVLGAGGERLAEVEAPRGAPHRPASAADLAAKVDALAGPGLRASLADLGVPAADVLQAAGLA
jgi:2-methylcitrate dehydratase PrpD